MCSHEMVNRSVYLTLRTVCLFLVLFLVASSCITLAFVWHPSYVSLFPTPVDGRAFVPFPVITPLHNLKAKGNHSKTLGIFSRILVVSLPRRVDRRTCMDKLKFALDMDWAYIDAFDSNETVVDNVMLHVHEARKNPEVKVDWLSMSHNASDSWNLPPQNLSLEATGHSTERLEPMACAQNDSDILDYKPSLPPHLILSRGMIACWLSHMLAIRLAALERADAISLILEDDVDIDWEIESKLRDSWHALPPSWDVVFLGYCWTSETFYPAIPHSDIIHPSHLPKCTHAYVLSAKGAQKLLADLRRPFFAYSRALDQAFVHLINLKRLEAYSYVPSLVVQMKETGSDIWGSTWTDGRGSMWREELKDSSVRRIREVERKEAKK